MKKQFVLIVGILTTAVTCSTRLQAQLSSDAREDIGLTQLRLANPGLTEGVGIQAHLVEAPVGGPDRYVANPSIDELSSNSLNFVGMPPTAVLSQITSGHATTSARNLFGTSGVARDLGTGGLSINMYAATANDSPTANTPTTDWLYGLIFNGGRDPLLSAFDRQTVSSHSYVFPRDPDGQLPGIMERLDHIIDQTDTTVVVGTDNGGALPPAWAPAYNALTVGLSGGGHGSGFTTTYGTGRVAIDVVAPAITASRATPIVAGAVAILQDSANDTDAANSEVIRATILAGATKDAGDIAGTWTRTTTVPLDPVYGAGELNIHNSYNIQQAGEFDGGNATNPATIGAGVGGWDYDVNLPTNGERIYEFVVEGGEELTDFSVVLAWNLNVVDNGQSQLLWNPSQELANLSLELFDSTDSFLGTLVDSSVSDVDNVEHVYKASGLTKGTYHLRVSNNADFETDFGLAWRGSLVPLLGDANGDGIVNNLDIMPFSTALFNRSVYVAMFPDLDPDVVLDMNGSGGLDNFDISGFTAALGF